MTLLTTSGWWINNIRIFVSDAKEEAGQIVPRLQPLGGATILQTFGYESDVRTVSALVIGEDDKDAIKALRTTGLAYVLDSPQGEIGSFYIKNVSINRVHAICQTVRPDLDSESAVYQVDIQLYE